MFRGDSISKAMNLYRGIVDTDFQRVYYFFQHYSCDRIKNGPDPLRRSPLMNSTPESRTIQSDGTAGAMDTPATISDEVAKHRVTEDALTSFRCSAEARQAVAANCRLHLG